MAVLRWARRRGYLWDARTCGFAAAGGRLAVLQWACQHVCPWGWGGGVGGEKDEVVVVGKLHRHLIANAQLVVRYGASQLMLGNGAPV